MIVKETDFRILELIEGLEYSFRVYAQNDAGMSRMSDESKATMAVSPVGKGGHFGNCSVAPILKNPK